MKQQGPPKTAGLGAFHVKQFCKNPFSVPAQQPDAVGGDGSRLTGNRLAGAEVPEAPARPQAAETPRDDLTAALEPAMETAVAVAPPAEPPEPSRVSRISVPWRIPEAAARAVSGSSSA